VPTHGFPANRWEVEGMGSFILAVNAISGYYEDLGTFHRYSYTKQRGKLWTGK
jgi:hypothetical protein